ncbi:MAG: ATP-dependent Clp protease ATP-binding subunit [Synergistaceae bacterium]|nr:ATP-dependent Clp protease ATP-binding subunit [Synergistaceae bacterium]
MWQFFTERGKKVIQLAHREALQLGHEVIGTEHILLGLIAEGEGVATQVLINQGLNLSDLRQQIEVSIGREQPKDKPVDLPLSPRAKRVLDLSMREARGMGVNYVGTEHILLGLVAESDGVAAQILSGLGITLPDLRRDIQAYLSGNRSEVQGGFTTVFPSAAPTQKKSTSKTPMLDQLGIDLTEMAKHDELDPVIGREKEIQRLVQILSRRTKNNPILIGDPGVGKTAIIEGLAQRIISGEIPEILKGRRVVQLNVANLVAGTKYRGEFEERMRRLVKELREIKNVVLFIDEIHTIVGAGGAEGSVDAANILKPSLARGEFQVIGATTKDEFKKYIEKDAALERRFQPIIVEEPSEADTVLILEGLRDRYEAHHRVKISDEALELSAKLSKRYITGRFLPDKAIDLIDEAAACARIKTMEMPEDLKLIERKLEDVRIEKEAAAASQEFEKAANLRDNEKILLEDLENARRIWHEDRNQTMPIVDGNNIASIVAEWTGIPVLQLTEAEAQRLLRMEEEIHKRMVGQDEALTAVSKAIRRARSGMKDPKRPVGSFLLLGPTGVGKTELARSLAHFLFGSEDAMVRFDMSEYMERHEVSKLIGAPPGYVGFEDGGKLTEAVRRRPYAVVLFDEIEKAHPDVFNMLLQLLEDGHLTDGQGNKTDFRNTVVIMTSNVGAQDIVRGQTLGFSIDQLKDSKAEWHHMKDTIMEAVRKMFKPEFLNRVDDVIVFRTLVKEELLKIVDIMLEGVIQRAAEQEVQLIIDENSRQLLIEKGFDPKYGARPLRRTIQRLIEDKLADFLLDGTIRSGSTLQVTALEQELNFSVEREVVS